MDLRERARFVTQAVQYRQDNQTHLGLSAQVINAIASSPAGDDEEALVARCRFSGFSTEGSIAQQEMVAVQWHEGYRFYHPERRLFVLWITHGFFRACVKNDASILTGLKSIEARAADIGLGISPRTVTQYIRDASARRGWWELRESQQDARGKIVIPTERLALIAHGSHLTNLAEEYGIRSKYESKINEMWLQVYRAQWSEMGYDLNHLYEIAKFVRENRTVPKSHI